MLPENAITYDHSWDPKLHSIFIPWNGHCLQDTRNLDAKDLQLHGLLQTPPRMTVYYAML